MLGWPKSASAWSYTIREIVGGAVYFGDLYKEINDYWSASEVIAIIWGIRRAYQMC